MDGVSEKVRKGRKFDQVLAGARQVFLDDGFERASVDAIARAAGVSKATLYSYFPDKRHLFTEVTRAECERQASEATASIDTTAPAPQVLRAAADHMIRFFTSRFALRIFRICLAESDRFPELGRDFYNSGTRVAEETLVAYIDEAASRGELRIEDATLAAHQFIELCKAELFQKYIFGIQSEFSEAEKARIARGAVEMFMARYGA